ncbi:MAG TPA: flagellar hook-length control protein FliK [Candidatus Sulfotelmatobacter sp.]|nr:flagellar hook-length control protein FliK [Candidatus Sulfotelmatobacter sp.]
MPDCNLGNVSQSNTFSVNQDAVAVTVGDISLVTTTPRAADPGFLVPIFQDENTSSIAAATDIASPNAPFTADSVAGLANNASAARLPDNGDSPKADLGPRTGKISSGQLQTPPVAVGTGETIPVDPFRSPIVGRESPQPKANPKTPTVRVVQSTEASKQAIPSCEGTLAISAVVLTDVVPSVPPAVQSCVSDVNGGTAPPVPSSNISAPATGIGPISSAAPDTPNASNSPTLPKKKDLQPSASNDSPDDAQRKNAGQVRSEVSPASPSAGSAGTSVETTSPTLLIHPTVTDSVKVASTDQFGTRSASSIHAPVEQALVPSGPVQVAQIVSKAAQSEMRIGLNTSAFGNVDVRTVVHAGNVGVVIGSEKGDLPSLLANEIPGIANTLQQQNLRLGQVNFQQGFSFSSGSFSQGQSQHRNFSSRGSWTTPLPTESFPEESGRSAEPRRISGLSILA